MSRRKKRRGVEWCEYATVEESIRRAVSSWSREKFGRHVGSEEEARISDGMIQRILAEASVEIDSMEKNVATSTSMYNYGLARRMAQERLWQKAGSPTFLIYPNMIEFCDRIELPRMDSSLVRMAMTEFVILFPRRHPKLLIPGSNHYITNCMVGEQRAMNIRALSGGRIEAGLEPLPEGEPGGIIVWMLSTAEGKDPIHLVSSAGMDDEGCTIYVQSIPFSAGETLQEAYERTINRSIYGYDSLTEEERLSSRSVTERVVKVVINLNFLLLSKNKDLIAPAVLAKDRPKLKNASPEEVVRLAKKAEKVWGKKVFWVGEILELPTKHASASRTEEGAALSGRRSPVAHMVSAHWKVVRHGPGRSLATPKLILPYLRGRRG